MKNKFPAIIGVFFFLTVLVPLFSAAQKKDSVKAAGVTAMVNNRQFTFRAQSVTPLAGRLRQLTSEYDLQVTTGKIIAYLPYFGRAYTAPVDPSKGGIQFTSKEFSYATVPRKKDGWNINITTKDLQDAQQLQLTVFSNGTATLQVTGNSRQSISYYGYITAPEKK